MSQPVFSYLSSDSSDADRERLRDAGTTVIALRRRGHHLGYLVRQRPPEQPEDLGPLWNATKPIHLPGVLMGGVEAYAPQIEASVEMFERLRRGGRFLDELEPRLAHQDRLVPAGSTFDRAEAREIEKVWMRAVAADEEGVDEVVADDIWAKLSWIANDDTDASLRISFSFGVEQLEEWRGDLSRAPVADVACEEAFPECDTITGHVPLIEALEELVETPLRFSERILYSNARGGGAIFHHDAEPDQRGVVFGQLAGRTAWLALPKADLAAHLWAHVEAHGPEELRERVRGVEDALRLLDEEDERQRFAILNQDPRFAERLVEAGAGFVLEPGDALLLPNHGKDDTCWHSVFAVGHKSLGHSYGMFPQL